MAATATVPASVTDSRNSDNVDEHRKIARTVRNGQCPAVWCSVCGYACRGNQLVVSCADANCPNRSHKSCLTPDCTSFNCKETSQLRLAANISDPVEYINSPSEDSDDLTTASKEDLIEIVTKLRCELSSKNSVLSSFNAISHELAAKRDAVVTVLELLDIIQAIQTGSDALVTKSISCSARSEKIDKDWEDKLKSNTAGGREAKLWWQEVSAQNSTSTSITSFTRTNEQRGVVEQGSNTEQQSTTELQGSTSEHQGGETTDNQRSQRPRNHQRVFNQINRREAPAHKGNRGHQSQDNQSLRFARRENQPNNRYSRCSQQLTRRKWDQRRS